MKASDLRIGNILFGVIFQRQVSVKGIVFFNSENFHRINCGFGVIEIETLKPIPLTEEWLARFGFIKIFGSFELKQNRDFMLQIDYENAGYKTCEITTSKKFGRNIQFIHQLQNLYHALTGDELELKTETK